jgi:phosphomannomutase
MLLDPEIRKRAEMWILDDPNIQTANAVQHLLDQQEKEDENENGSSATAAAAAAELCKLFPADPLQRISFGTAGLRGPMVPGPLGMNDLVVVQAAQGLAKYCLEQHHRQDSTLSASSLSSSSTGENKLCAVVGYDHRANPSLHLSSLSFALLTALVFIEAGMECFLLDGFVATPLVPFALSQLQGGTSSSSASILPWKAVVGIMITASHNPKQDAGYKVYWNDGCQIRSPVDQGIAASIQRNLRPWKDYRETWKCRHQSDTTSDNNCDPCLGLSRKKETQEMIQAYFAAIKVSGLYTGQAQKHFNSIVHAPKFCYTAMHGVGHHFAKTCFQQTFGLPPFESVPEQQEPDPSFPTVAFPNPEERGALDLAMQHAQRHNCNIVLANDPDADRLAVAEYDPTSKKWTTFTGDQIGVMLGHWLWTQLGSSKQDDSRPVSMCMSTVSSKMLAEIGRREGFHVEETLTGFKWIGSRAASLQTSEGYRNIFCYEEAIGFCCGNVIFDKDGITACAVLAELALHVYGEKRQMLTEHMQSLYDTYGEFLSHNGYFFLPRDRDPAIISTAIFSHITNQGRYDRKTVGSSYEIESIRDLGHPGYDSTTSDKKPTLPTSKSSPMLTLRFTNGCVAQFRSSGTEPKFKYYVELRGKPGVARSTVQDELDQMSAVLLEELLQPVKHGLTRAASKL